MTQVSSKLSVAQPNDPIVHASFVRRLAGASLLLPRSEFDLAVTEERARIAATGAASGIYSAGQTFRIVGEVGVRVWTVGTGGTDAAIAAASHARTVALSSGKTVLLPSDVNGAISVSGAPTAGTDGDLAVDATADLYWVKTAGVWAVAGNVLAVTFDPPTQGPNGAIVIARADNTFVAPSVVYTRTFASGVYHFNVGKNAAGQVVYVSPWGAGAAGAVGGYA